MPCTYSCSSLALPGNQLLLHHARNICTASSVPPLQAHLLSQAPGDARLTSSSSLSFQLSLASCLPASAIPLCLGGFYKTKMIKNPILPFLSQLHGVTSHATEHGPPHFSCLGISGQVPSEHSLLDSFKLHFYCKRIARLSPEV